MPINKEAFLRYRIIDRLIRDKNHPYPNMDYIIDELEEQLGKPFSVSTIQKDIKSMKEDQLLGYNAPIKFHRAYSGYYYTDPNYNITEVPLSEEDIDAIEFAAMTLQQFKDVKLFGNFGSAVDKIFNAVSVNSVLNEEEVEQLVHFEQVPYYKGSEWIAPILEHIKKRKTIILDYKRFEADKAKQHELHPILLKEYRNRWYLIAMLEKNDRIIILALDRVQQITESKSTYRYHPQFSSENYFKYAYGITTFDEAPSEVIIECNAVQASYIKTQALHHTQKIVKETDDIVQFSYKVGITTELIMDLLSFGDGVKVIQPESLQEEIKKRLTNALKNYN